MATSEAEVRKTYNSMLIPLGIIYSKYLADGRGPSGHGSGARDPVSTPKRVFSEIPLVFGSVMGHQLGAFLGDLDSERYMYESYNTTRTAVIINVEEANTAIPDITINGVALLIAHELGHAFRWYRGHEGGNNGYTNEVWARMLELAYVEAIYDNSFHARMIGVEFAATVAFIKKHRKSLYRGSAEEKSFYADLTGDNAWPVEATKAPSKCPKGDPDCFRPPQIVRLHVNCKPPD